MQLFGITVEKGEKEREREREKGKRKGERKEKKGKKGVIERCTIKIQTKNKKYLLCTQF